MTKRTREMLEDHTRGDASVLTCPRCKAETRHRVIASRNVRSEEGDADFSVHSQDDYEIIECQGCWGILFRHRHTNSEDYVPTEAGDEYLETIRVYPRISLRSSRLESVFELPYPIRDLYLEASQALDYGLHHLVAIALSSLIQAILRERGVTGDTPHQMVGNAVETGLITASEGDALHRVRQLRNAADHEAEKPQEDAVVAAFTVLEHLLTRYYTVPNIAERIKRSPPLGGAKSTPDDAT